MSKKEINNITLLVHSEFVVFEWGKALIDIFSAQASKYNLKIVCDVKDIDNYDCPIIILGVDSKWIKSVLDALKTSRNRIVLIDGIADKNYEYVSHVSADQHTTIKKCIDLLKSNQKTKTALFGVQKNDTSDNIKAVAFSEAFCSDDVYEICDDINECCDRLLGNIDKYDSVICTNDILAVYLLMRCKAVGIEIPKQLHLIGNGDVWIASHVSPSITTVSYNVEATVKMVLQVCENLCDFQDVAPVNIGFCGHIINRESTGTKAVVNNCVTNKRIACFNFDYAPICKELSQIVTLNRVFSSYSQEKIQILKLLLCGQSISKIAQSVFLSQDTVAYHLKKLYKQLNIHSKKELIEILNSYNITF